MNTINLIIAPQEYETANHKFLWMELSKKLEGSTLVINIPADQIVTRIKRKYYRLKEANAGTIHISENLSLFRPKFFIRPEISPRFLNKTIRNNFIKQLKKYYPDINKSHINVISYGGRWIDILSGWDNARFYYYILDEVKLFAHTNEENHKAITNDLIGCKKSDCVFTMSEKILLERKKNCKKIIVVGNGATVNEDIPVKLNKINKSVGFIGNFRSWIDIELLEEVIRKNADINFAIVGPVQDEMRNVLIKLLNDYRNTSYMGTAKKEEIHLYYRMFDVVIVPYKQNDFMLATRPIKIVESIFAGTPVVSVPNSGYAENSFIRFATNASDFSSEIINFLNNPIDTEADEYKRFIKNNSWQSVAEKIADIINDY